MNNESIIEACARAAHEVNRAYCIAIGDYTQVAWEHAADWQKSSARDGVAGALDGNTPEQSHEAWMADKIAAGWTFGPTKDPETKQHPRMVPYAELPASQRQKDSLFVSTVRCMAASLGGVVRYPASPGFPAHTRDWSTGADTPDPA